MQSDKVTTAICSWTPRLYSKQVAAFTRRVVLACQPETPARARALIYAVAKLASFATSHGVPLSAEMVFHTSVIERYLSTEATKLAPATARTVATNLKAAARLLIEDPSPKRKRHPREMAKMPYSASEIEHYLTLAAWQPTESRRMRITALICLGAGAGIIGTDLRHVRGTSIKEVSGGLVVQVVGVHARIVPVLNRFQEPLRVAARFAGDSFIIGGTDSARKNVTSDLVASFAGGKDLIPLETRRLRATWLSSTAEAIGLKAFMEAAGVVCSQRLGDIVSYLPPVSEQDAVRLLSGGR
jgi:hypothetical protein